MANTKQDVRVTINLEGIVVEAFRNLARKEQISISSYGRRLIIQELVRKDLLPMETVKRLFVGAEVME